MQRHNFFDKRLWKKSGILFYSLFIFYFFASGHREQQRLREPLSMEINKITEAIIGCAIEVHKHLGPGLLESTYESCLYYEMIKAGLTVQRQQAMPLIYKEVHMEHGYRLDFLVENCVVVEVKMTEGIADVHIAQTLTYLKLSGAKVGLIINFNVLKLIDGIKRLIART